MTTRSIRLIAVSFAVTGSFALSAAGCGSSSTKSTAPATTVPTGSATTASGGTAAAATAAVRIVNFSFQPMTVTVKTGGTVTWTQVDQVGHSVQSTTGAWTTSSVLNPGQTFSHTFAKAGTYPYICGVHNYMHGTVKVVG